MEAENYNFLIEPGGVISDKFLARGVTDFKGAANYIRHLPYRRNSAKTDVCLVFTEECGTCSTKHAVLHRLATENCRPEVNLMLGLFRMNSGNTPKAASVLQKHGLPYLPEAHNYLKIADTVLDCTTTHSSPATFYSDLISDHAISPEQIGHYKVQLHRSFLKKWLANQPHLQLSLADLWKIREECIQALSS